MATEFDLDRRTVAARVRNIAPAGKLKGNNAWRLADVAPCLTEGSAGGLGRQVPLLPPADLPYLPNIENKMDAGAYVMGTLLAYRAGAMAAVVAAHLGAPMKMAYALKDAMTLGTMMAAENVGSKCGFEPYRSDPEADLYELAALDEVDWEALAKNAGEAVDVEAWEKWKTEQLGEYSEDEFFEDE